MSRGKYSPYLPKANPNREFKYNCFKQLPVPWSREIADSGVAYDEKTMFDQYDEEGFDSYGYSAFDAECNYVGIGNGIDRLGYTEDEYLCMPDDEFDSL